MGWGSRGYIWRWAQLKGWVFDETGFDVGARG
jgi:hypothetical protein